MPTYKEEKEIFRKLRIFSQELAKRFGIKKVYLFGSLAKGLFFKGSDIDLAIEGMDFEDYLKAIAEYRFIKGIHIDLLNLDFCKANFKEEILKDGKVLYEKE
jgi:predicted nucleotidyltransferase